VTIELSVRSIASCWSCGHFKRQIAQKSRPKNEGCAYPSDTKIFNNGNFIAFEPVCKRFECDSNDAHLEDRAGVL
jgi:hypothetical protein